MTWDDDTQKGYEEWERAHGNKPPPFNWMDKEMERRLKMKEENMPVTSKPANNTGEDFKSPEGLQDVFAPITDDLVTNPTGEESILHKRTRRKGFPYNVTVVEVKTAYIELYIPKRPEGMSKVIISIFYYDGEKTAKRDIDWPEGMTAIEAIQAHFPQRAEFATAFIDEETGANKL